MFDCNGYKLVGGYGAGDTNPQDGTYSGFSCDSYAYSNPFGFNVYRCQMFSDNMTSGMTGMKSDGMTSSGMACDGMATGENDLTDNEYSGYGCDEYYYNDTTGDYNMFSCDITKTGTDLSFIDGYYGYNGLDCESEIYDPSGSGTVQVFGCNNMNEHW